MTIKVNSDVRRVVVRGGGRGAKRKVFVIDRDERTDPADEVKVTVVRRDERGRLVGRELYESGERRRRKRSKSMLRPVERTMRQAVELQSRILGNYLREHERSNAERRDGWLRDMPTNLTRAIRRSKPRSVFRDRDDD